MKYLFKMSHSAGTILVIVKNPEIKDNTVHATKVGEFTGWDEKGEVYEACRPVIFVAGGGPWTLTEFSGQMKVNK